MKRPNLSVKNPLTGHGMILSLLKMASRGWSMTSRWSSMLVKKMMKLYDDEEKGLLYSNLF